MTTEKNVDELTGEKNITGAPRYELPIVSLQGVEGVFHKKTKDKEGVMQTDLLGKSIQVVPLVWKRVLNRFITGSSGKVEEIIFSSEHSAFNDNVTIFSSKNGKTMMIETGQAKAMKEEHKLKMTQVIYALMETSVIEKNLIEGKSKVVGKGSGEIIKLQVKGSGLSNLYEFRPEVKKLGKHFREILIDLGVVEKESPLGKYFAMTFKIKKELNEKEKENVIEKIREVAGKLQDISDHYAETYKEEDKPPVESGSTMAEAKKEAIGTTEQIKENSEPEIPVVEDNVKPEEIDVGSIPF